LGKETLKLEFNSHTYSSAYVYLLFDRLLQADIVDTGFYRSALHAMYPISILLRTVVRVST